MMIILLDHILYGVAARTLADDENNIIRITALSAGPLGEQINLSIAFGPALTIGVNESNIAITVVEGVTTEAALIAAINGDEPASALIEASQVSGDGTAFVLEHGPANLVAASGLIQALTDEFDLNRWDDRELSTTAEMQALLWIGRIETERQPPVGWATFNAMVQAGLAITNKLDFSIQNIQLLQLGRRVAYIVRRFKAANLNGVAVLETTFTNTMREESAGKVVALSSARMRVLVTAMMNFRQPADLNPAVDPLITSVDLGLWRQPLEEEPGGPGADKVDTLTINP
jgi:hypothetical protein